nr:hypothetical protein [Rhizosolenia setigera]
MQINTKKYNYYKIKKILSGNKVSIFSIPINKNFSKTKTGISFYNIKSSVLRYFISKSIFRNLNIKGLYVIIQFLTISNNFTIKKLDSLFNINNSLFILFNKNLYVTNQFKKLISFNYKETIKSINKNLKLLFINSLKTLKRVCN